MQPQQQQCLNCRRSFQQGETLPPEGIHIEYKKYYLPIKDHQPKWILLKTIVAFLNSKGGTIFMGVDDSTREVVGVPAELKQQDMFMLDFAQLLDNIQPEVDLRHREQVKVRFVPVLKDKTFQGKYIIKIVVKQGDPAKVYHFAQTLKFVNEDRKHHDEEFKVLWGFYRSNMGKVDAIKGTELLREVYEKAKRPSIVVEPTHSGCNPEPLQVSVRNMNIGFKSLRDPQLKSKILQFIQKKLRALNLQTSYSIQELKDDDTVILKFKSITQYKTADSCIAEHQREISEMIEGKDSLIDEGFIDSTHFYKVGQAFNPSLRYLRNRSKSRNRSIEINDKKSAVKEVRNEVKTPVAPKSQGKNVQPQVKPHNPTQNQTRFRPAQQDKKEDEFIYPKNQFVKNIPKEQQAEEQAQQEQEWQDESSSPQKETPKKQFKLSPEQFPSIPAQPETKIKVNGPKQPSQSKEKQESPIHYTQVSVQHKDASKQKLHYQILISNIFQNNIAKVQNYLEHSLGSKVEKIPRKIQHLSNGKEIVVNFASLKDVESFEEEMGKNLHHRHVLNGFGEGKSVNIIVKKGINTEPFRWIQQHDQPKHPKKDHQDKKKPTQSKESSTSQQRPTKSSSGKNPVQSFIQKVKQKTEQVKGFPFVISNLRMDLTEVEKTHLADLLREIFKRYCPENSKVQILNEKTLVGIVELDFETAEQRKSFSDLMQTEIIKYHELTDFFKGHKAFWGVPSGNVIIHHYKSDDKKIFKEQVEKLFPANGQVSFTSSKFVKQQNKYFLSLSFHPNKLTKALERIYQNVVKSPIADYASSKQGIVVLPQINRI